MRAFLLAAGVGSRLGSLTEHTPKCLLPIGERPLLDYWFEAFAEAGVNEVLINLHHLSDQVEQYLASMKYSIVVRRFYEPTLLGSAGTIRKAWNFVQGERSFLIVYADNFARVNLRRLLEFHAACGNPVLSLLAYHTDEPTRCGILEFSDDHKVVSFEEKPAQPKSNFANAGIHVGSSELLDYLPEQKPADLGFHVLPRLIGKMYGYVTDEYIQDIGTPENYTRVLQYAAATQE